MTTTHPFLPGGQGISDVNAMEARAPSTPQELIVRTPAAGRHVLVVSRTQPVQVPSFGAFSLTVDEVRAPAVALSTTLEYRDDFVLVQGRAAKLDARLTGSDGGAVAGRPVSFDIDGEPGPCPGGCTATTDYRGDALVSIDPAALAPGVHEVAARFTGDAFWKPSSASALVIVIGTTLPGPGGQSGGHVTAGGWFGEGKGNERVHFSFHAQGSLAPSGELRYRDRVAEIDVTLVSFSALVVEGDEATLTGTVRHDDGRTDSFALTARDLAEPGKGRDRVRLWLGSGYDRSGTLGGGNVQIHR